MFKQSSEYKSIQKKLVAAVAMVLVASLMVVSSSYAWFTLSTAPEVTGITTSVGSNGNLEMALNTTGDVDDITTSVGKEFPEANNYWGNLVDLSDASYALSEISLVPARLNATGSINAAGTASGANLGGGGFLSTPTYGTDGRVSGFETSTETGSFNGTDFVPNAAHWGVRAVGISSGLSAGAKALRDARSAVNTAKNNVTRNVRASLEVDAINLANLIIANQLAAKTAVTSTEWGQVVTAVENLEAIAAELKTTMDKVVNAVAVAQNVDMTGKTITYSADGATVADTTLAIPAELNAGLGKAYTSWTSINTKLTSARGTIDGATANGDGTYAYDTVETIMTQILSVGDITLGEDENGDDITLTGKSKDEIVPIVMDAYLDNEGKLPLYIVGGIYADIEAFIGAYSASAKMTVSLAGTNYANLGFGESVNVTAQMKVENGAPVIIDNAEPTADVVSYYLDYFVVQLSGLTASDAGTGSSTTPLDVYGYAIDLAFRTNAANSHLMLQTAATSRVGDDTTSALQGGGSYMEFKIGSTTNGYTLDQMEDLMGAIRVVLIDTESETGEIFAVAALDMGVAERDDAAGTIKAYLYLYEFEIGTDGVLVLGDKIVTDNTDGTKTAIAALTQNQALAMTALVYLDGDYVDNSDVAISGDSMTGTLNLQFSSDATLEPMDYTFDEEEEGEKLAAPTNVAVADDGTLTFTAADNATSYEIYVNGARTGKTVTGSVNLSTALTGYDLTAFKGQEVTITLVSVADNYRNSDPSNGATYTVPNN